MAAPFVSPPADAILPEVPKWVPPPTTKLVTDWADLHTIDLSLLDSPDPQVVEKLLEVTKLAIKEDGFLFLTNYGVSLEQVKNHITAIRDYFTKYNLVTSPVRSSPISSPEHNG